MMDLSVAVPSQVSLSAMQHGFLVVIKSLIDVVLFLTYRTFRVTTVKSPISAVGTVDC